MNFDMPALLVLLGSLFLLLGCTGEIFSKHLSVKLSQLTARIVLASVGLFMLGIGIIGPDKLLSPTQAAEEEEPEIITETPAIPSAWFFNIAGSYQGQATSTGQAYPVRTTFSIDSKNKIIGTYIIQENTKRIGGTLTHAEITGPKAIQFKWHDDNGSGILQVEFSEDLDSFTGHWGAGNTLDDSAVWNGVRE
ncbi:hypothetical protein KFZ76_19715 [Methylovulum psychrotolerans]|uniref:hypothetical protein n=1 Tax=Methylovulum psychrotolerans TaxID=1704499 RepID=UPI001BFEFE45|nr:hypothetical protein [Methylovulum psychrotolerans]MBT9099930.1 hypothetical protein [Methylovulum psychrotolerans]